MIPRDELLGGGTPPSGRWTTIAQWRTTGDSLVAVFDYPDPSYALGLLPYALERLGGRDLQVAVPTDAVEATRHRAAMLTADIEVLEQVGAEVRPVPASTSGDALVWYAKRGPVTDVVGVDEFNGPPWLVDLVDWLESRRVERIRRSQYWSWHYRGRQILRIGKSGGTYRLLAGVAYAKPREDQPAPVRVEAAADPGPTAQEIETIKEALDRAIERRRVGVDRGHREHLLQAALAVDPSILAMTRLVREFPAWRPSLSDAGGRGFIDFLGVDVDGGLHVIETKIGPDPMLGLQGLDYWAWVTAHKDEVSACLGLEPSEEPVGLHYVIATSGKTLIHQAAAETMRRLGPDIPWRCHVITDWNTVDRPRRLLRPQPVAGIRARTVPYEGMLDGPHR